MADRVKLCAIAKNEGAYLADWVFHHLHFGFDAIEIWVNGTDDGSRRILRSINAGYPQVTSRRVDRLLQECVAAGENFQERAYERLARRAKRAGFTHVAFLDLDEYWTPRDFRSGIKEFIPDDPEVKAVSFLWGLDVPDPARRPFSPPFEGPERVQLDRHVKSIIRMDGSVRRFRAHTARIRGGRRLLVREPFPLVDKLAQRQGSFVTDEFLASHRDRLPEALVLHALNRSPLEYVATLATGTSETGQQVRVKGGRYAYLPTSAPVLTLDPPARAHRAYLRSRRRFRAQVHVDGRVRSAQGRVEDRARALLREAESDSRLRAELEPPLRGVPVSTVKAELGAHPT